MVVIDDPACELRVVQSSEEWGYLRQNRRPAVGTSPTHVGTRLDGICFRSLLYVGADCCAGLMCVV